ncbi:hypothetical protein M9H77_05889 [Catharanthus roseus]|uniref:Uncharacterized protein n=1 Tax=Catharanthus roseus TaxID=4058 RepID=A0ACC0BQP1_CATRO|nr:hypothetical protein M9H77_05889 [Catharanthus roseus]
MKKTHELFLSLVLFSIYTYSFTSAEPVLDAGGKILRPDAYYYMVPADIRDKGRGGGLTLSGIGNYTCPLTVVQELYETKIGLPLRFYPLHEDTKKGTAVPLSTDLNIEFSYPERCGESTIWKLEDYDEYQGKYFVGVGGVVGDLSPEALSNWFKIEKYGYGYKLLYCPTICSDCEVVCKNIGIVYENGQRRLALTDVRPLKFLFKLAK